MNLSPNYSGASCPVAEERWFFCPKQIVQFLVLFSLTLSLSAGYGVTIGLPLLSRWIPGGIGMTPDTSLGISLAAAGLWLAQSKYSRMAPCLGICLLGLASLNLLIRDVAGGALTHLFFHRLTSSHIAPATIAVLLLLGIALLFMGGVGGSLSASALVAALGTTIFSIAFVTLIGYASGMNTASWWSNFLLRMALPTAVASCALGIATIATPFQLASKGRQRWSLALAVSATFGLLLLLASLAAVWTSLNTVAIALADLHATSDEIQSITALVDEVRQAEAGQRVTCLPKTGGT